MNNHNSFSLCQLDVAFKNYDKSNEDTNKNNFRYLNKVYLLELSNGLTELNRIIVETVSAKNSNTHLRNHISKSKLMEEAITSSRNLLETFESKKDLVNQYQARIVEMIVFLDQKITLLDLLG